MASYSYFGGSLEVPDGTPLDTVTTMIAQKKAEGATNDMGGATAPPTTTPDLNDEAAYQKSAATYYKMRYGPTAQVPQDPNELKDWANREMRWFDINTPTMAVDAVRMKQAAPEQRAAFLHLLDYYDNKTPYSMKGVADGTVAALTDPLNMLGLATLGIGTAGKVAGQVATKATIKAMLRAGLVTGIDTAMQSGAQDLVKQTAVQNAGGQDGYNLGQTAVQTAVGGVLGAGIGAASVKVADVVGSYFRKPEVRPIIPPGEIVPLVGKKDAPLSAREIAANEAQKAAGTPDAAAATTVAGEAPKPTGEAPTASAEAPTGAAAAEAPTPITAESPRPPAMVRGKDGKFTKNPEYAAWKEAQAAAEAETAKPPEALTGNPVLDAVHNAVTDTGLQGIIRSKGELGTKSKAAVDALLKIAPEDIERTAAQLANTPLEPAKHQVLANAVLEGNKKMEGMHLDLWKAVQDEKDPVLKSKLEDAYMTLGDVRTRTSKLDQAFGSESGMNLGVRQGIFNTKDRWNLNVDDLIRSNGGDPLNPTREQKLAANQQFSMMYKGWEEGASIHQNIQALNDQIDRAWERGDRASVMSLTQEKARMMDDLIELQARQQGLSTKIAQAGSSFSRALLEANIGAVFSPSTVMINFLPSALKTLYKPALDAIAHGADTTALKQMTATYAGMYASIGLAFRRAKLVMDIEQTISGNGQMDMFKPAIPNYLGGRIIRFFPRLNNAVDEFFHTIHYRGYTAGYRSAEAYEAGIKQGLSHNDAGAAAERAYQDALNKAYSGDVSASATMDTLRHAGAMKGLSGARLDEYAVEHLARDEDLFGKATDKQGMDYANDILFKRNFTGEGVASRAAQTYERVVNEFPIMRVFGQLFFKTPVRVFEEGIRTTPGLNLIAPHFLADLRGARGEMRQTRAIGESMMAYAMAGTMMVLYAQGKITGSGPENFRDRRILEDGKQWEQYSIKLGDGTNLSFRNLDPFSTHMKIMSNIMEKLSLLYTREAQGDQVGGMIQNLEQQMGLWTGAIASAIHDANLLTGASSIADWFTAASNPERNDTKTQRLLGNRLSGFIPATLRKAIGIADPTMTDPNDVPGYLKQGVMPWDASVAKQYTAFGKVRINPSPWAAFTAVHLTTQDMRNEGSTDKERFVSQKLAQLSTLTGSHFFAPYKTQYVGYEGKDLRAIPTADGKSTLYDRWNENVFKLHAVDRLYNMLKPLDRAPIGSTGRHASEYTKAISNELTGMRATAFTQMISQDNAMRQQMRQGIKDNVFKKVQGVVPTPYQ